MLSPNQSLMDLLSQDERPDDSMDTFPLEPERGSMGFELKMKKKRRAALLSAMLREQGYGDLAKIAAIRETRGINRGDEDGY